MLLQTMELDTIPIVYVDVFLLRNGKVLVIVKPSDVWYPEMSAMILDLVLISVWSRTSDCRAQLQLASQFAFPEVH